MKFLLQKAASLILIASISGCASTDHSYSKSTPLIIQPISTSEITDLSSEFRSEFCGRLLSEPINDVGCDKHFYFNSHQTAVSIAAEIKGSKTLVVIVPGILGECIADEISPFEVSIPTIEKHNSNFRFITLKSISGRASSTFNAERIHKELEDLKLEDKERIFVISYSKGTTDFLHYLSLYSKKSSKKIDALISISGVVNGTAVADKSSGLVSKLVSKLPLKECPTQDSSGIESLSLSNQLSWLADNNDLFKLGIPMYSLVSSTKTHNTSSVFLPFHSFLEKSAGINDGQVNAVHQILPSSKLLGHLNADHWAVALPFSDKTYSDLSGLNQVVKRLATKNKFPRLTLLQSILQTVSNDLESNYTER